MMIMMMMMMMPRTEEKVGLMIVLVWLLSLLISIPPLLYPPWSIPYPSHAEIQVPEL